MVTNSRDAGGSELNRLLRVLQLADSALPVGSLAHSFGLESLIADEMLRADGIFSYMEDLLRESLLVEAVFCRSAHALKQHAARLKALSARLDALRVARESREASLALGRRLVQLLAGLDETFSRGRAGLGEIHLSIAFGYGCGVLGIEADPTVAAFLHQNILGSLSAAQRLLPLGQIQSSQIAWDLKAAIADAVTRSAVLDVDSVAAFTHLPELASMRHPLLATRLFIS